jgi:hypothetical protein
MIRSRRPRGFKIAAPIRHLINRAKLTRAGFVQCALDQKSRRPVFEFICQCHRVFEMPDQLATFLRRVYHRGSSHLSGIPQRWEFDCHHTRLEFGIIGRSIHGSMNASMTVWTECNHMSRMIQATITLADADDAAQDMGYRLDDKMVRACYIPHIFRWRAPVHSRERPDSAGRHSFCLAMAVERIHSRP